MALDLEAMKKAIQSEPTPEGKVTQVIDRMVGALTDIAKKHQAADAAKPTTSYGDEVAALATTLQKNSADISNAAKVDEGETATTGKPAKSAAPQTHPAGSKK